MATRYDTKALKESAASLFEAQPDPSGQADLVSEKGSIVVAGEPAEFKAAFKRLKKVEGYRWLVINKEDLFAANTLSIGSKVGILSADGQILKNADLPRRKT